MASVQCPGEECSAAPADHSNLPNHPPTKNKEPRVEHHQRSTTTSSTTTSTITILPHQGKESNTPPTRDPTPTQPTRVTVLHSTSTQHNTHLQARFSGVSSLFARPPTTDRHNYLGDGDDGGDDGWMDASIIRHAPTPSAHIVIIIRQQQLENSLPHSLTAYRRFRRSSFFFCRVYAMRCASL